MTILEYVHILTCTLKPENPEVIDITELIQVLEDQYQFPSKQSLFLSIGAGRPVLNPLVAGSFPE